MDKDDLKKMMKQISLDKVKEEMAELEAIRSKMPEGVYNTTLNILKGFELVGQENEPNPNGMKPGILSAILKQYNIEV